MARYDIPTFFSTVLVAALGSLGPLGSLGLATEETPLAPLFPFVVSYDTPKNVTNLSDRLDRPAGKDGFVRCEEGHFVTEAGPIRFWATNLCFEACFPSRDQADRLARRLARLGINCVRMHHMDMYSIWGDRPNHLEIDPKKMDRLDYLIFRLKEHGIYTNLNLHVSRWLDEKDGFPPRDGRPQFDKGLDNFEPRLIALQKQYARDLLTHVNPYTGIAYTDEPAVAMVEVNNENGLFFIWSQNQLDDLPEPFQSTYQKLWNRWLVKKYGAGEKLRAAWREGQTPLGDEMIQDGRFEAKEPKSWFFNLDQPPVAHWSVESDGPEGKRCLRFCVERSGKTAWLPQFGQGGLAFEKGQTYTLSFWLRAKTHGRLSVNAMQNHAPWSVLGLGGPVEAKNKWRRVTLSFTAKQDDPDGRITFTAMEPNTYELADVSLRAGGIEGLAEKERLEDGSVRVIAHESPRATPRRLRDFVDFLWETERDYWQQMYRFLKDDLQVQAPISGSQLGFSLPSLQSGFGYLDAHSYWNHPVFTGDDWDAKHWFVRNRALVNYPDGTFTRLAARRVWNRPYTVSEYNHPEPNEFAAEGFPMIAAFGAFQKWDGIFSFTYKSGPKPDPRRIRSFFDIEANTAKLVHMPACVSMFVRADVQPGNELILARLSVSKERDLLVEKLSPWGIKASAVGCDFEASLLHRMGLAAVSASDTNGSFCPQNGTVSGDQKVFVSDTGQLQWDTTEPKAGFFTVDSPRTKLFTGFIRGRRFSIGDVKLEVGRTRLDWATVSMTLVEGDRFDRPGRVLIAATGVTHNADMTLKREGPRVTVGNQWGDAPVLCEGIPARIMLPVAAGRVRLYPLDESGNRRDEVRVKDEADQAVLTLSPKYRTVWYEAVIE